MLRFVVRRLLSSIPVLFGILLATFAIARIIPGDPCQAALQERATPQACADFNERYGFDDPILVQFVDYVGDVATGDLGESIRLRQPVTDLLIERLPVTLQLSVAALFLAVLLGVPLGVLAGTRHNSRTDVATIVGANLGVSIPVFVLGLLLQYVFAVQLDGSPLELPTSGQLTPGTIPEPFYEVWGIPESSFVEFVANIDLLNAVLIWRWDIFVDALRHLVLPALALATIPMAVIARMTRSSLLDVLGLDYVRTARAKGLRERVVIVRHALRNSLLPVVTVVGLSLGTLVGGAILTETIFNLTGMGKTLFDAIEGRDYFVVQGFTLVVAVGFVVINLITDIVYTFLDPKVRVS
ncbi:MAG: ABC transporter permease [Thermoanaerobacterales bacterium]|nr:ABC transporter permease [Thermoanaerobacterales bacterium]